eukprot:TRINITY_DN2257_c0_g3_i1.p1 TRINITY_DN2257_c0_g3~~TRINITY_DN2257_c0_g3_i1.p1  ORF type:complete len:629 (+),score=72.95 TRINITY_DN2257_c0_g3_i1:58-1944(+)
MMQKDIGALRLARSQAALHGRADLEREMHQRTVAYTRRPRALVPAAGVVTPRRAVGDVDDFLSLPLNELAYHSSPRSRSVPAAARRTSEGFYEHVNPVGIGRVMVGRRSLTPMATSSPRRSNPRMTLITPPSPARPHAKARAQRIFSAPEAADAATKTRPPAPSPLRRRSATPTPTQSQSCARRTFNSQTAAANAEARLVSGRRQSRQRAVPAHLLTQRAKFHRAYAPDSGGAAVRKAPQRARSVPPMHRAVVEVPRLALRHVQQQQVQAKPAPLRFVRPEKEGTVAANDVTGAAEADALLEATSASEPRGFSSALEDDPLADTIPQGRALRWTDSPLYATARSDEFARALDTALDDPIEECTSRGTTPRSPALSPKETTLSVLFPLRDASGAAPFSRRVGLHQRGSSARRRHAASPNTSMRSIGRRSVSRCSRGGSRASSANCSGMSSLIRLPSSGRRQEVLAPYAAPGKFYDEFAARFGAAEGIAAKKKLQKRRRGGSRAVVFDSWETKSVQARREEAAAPTVYKTGERGELKPKVDIGRSRAATLLPTASKPQDQGSMLPAGKCEMSIANDRSTLWFVGASVKEAGLSRPPSRRAAPRPALAENATTVPSTVPTFVITAPSSASA